MFDFCDCLFCFILILKGRMICFCSRDEVSHSMHVAYFLSLSYILIYVCIYKYMHVYTYILCVHLYTYFVKERGVGTDLN